MVRLGSIARRLERLWRQIGTGFSFAVFGIGGLILAVFFFPALNLFYRHRERRAKVAQRIVHVTWKLFVWLIVTLRAIDFETEGEDILKSETGTLVIANHPSLVDIVLIMSLMDRTQCVVKPGVWRNPFMHGVVRAANYIPNLGNSELTLSQCVAALQAGNNLVIFPEGSRTVPGAQLRLDRGFANIAVRAGAPIRLVTVSCDPPMLRKGEKWYQSPATRPCFRVRVRDRVDTASLFLTEIPSRAARQLTAQIAERFEELVANEYA